MKKNAIIFSLFWAFVAFSTNTNAQTSSTNTLNTQQARPGRAILEVPSLTAEEQFLVLKSSVLDKVEGLSMATWNANHKQLALSYDLNKTNATQIVELLAKNGYTATIYVSSESPKATKSN